MWTVALQEIPAYCNLGGVVLVHAGKASVAGTCVSVKRTVHRTKLVRERLDDTGLWTYR